LADRNCAWATVTNISQTAEHFGSNYCYLCRIIASASTFKIMGRFGVTEILVILVIVLLLFGGKKIPELMKGLGSGIKEFKNAAKDDQPAASKKDEEPKA
jgi:sec-independent protein translocase protein TatA